MLSICIPVFNVNITKLIHTIIEQVEFNDFTIEILIYDDGSSTKYKTINQPVVNYKEVKYKELERNIGSAAIRNLMASNAAYNNLLFVDSDSEIPKDYLANYFSQLNKHLILCGGRKHPEQLPSANKRLRWIVGKNREDFGAKERALIPNKSFMSNNFLVKKELFEKIKFDENIKRSGHEDTMMGIEMECNNITIQHIDNPVIHIGLEDNDEFIAKTKQRTETLLFLLDEKSEYKNLMKKRIKLLRYFYLAKATGTIKLFAYLYKTLQNQIEKNLSSKSPSMFLFDLLKIGYLSKIYLSKYK
ncbi:glycosyltransferase family 2 protein [Carboxylicivirga marina]|uniref:glycosyltransferase family 2 protein n=1 Tax=Carboxylicivirga marina TaxID=2800988 RepID=UPI0025965F1D|nr:glycosyltransferase [uncultured Carboxylicivirga sp.]